LEIYMANVNLYFGQANNAVQDAIAIASNPGVVPPGASYLEPNHYVYHHRLGQNARAAGILLPIMDLVTMDLSYPSNATIAITGPELWDVLSPNFKQPNDYGAAPNFPPLDAPPAPPGTPWIPL
jgi:hypothetical protein